MANYELAADYYKGEESNRCAFVFCFSRYANLDRPFIRLCVCLL